MLLWSPLISFLGLRGGSNCRHSPRCCLFHRREQQRPHYHQLYPDSTTNHQCILSYSLKYEPLEFSMGTTLALTSEASVQRAKSVTGVTSLLQIPGECDGSTDGPSLSSSGNVSTARPHPLVVIGTKNGDIALVRFVVSSKRDDYDVDQQLPSCTLYCRSTVTIASWKTCVSVGLPVYSLAYDSNLSLLLVGGADRYLSIWQLPPLWQLQQFRGDDNGDTNTIQVQKGTNGSRQGQLAPVEPIHRLRRHTGWVKATILTTTSSNIFTQQASRRLFTIGCNRIETWTEKKVNATDSPPSMLTASSAAPWVHSGTISVDSECPESVVGNESNRRACTLSSDLLCLAMCQCRPCNNYHKDDNSTAAGGTTVSILAAGGVDGRIHFFWDDSIAVAQRQKTCALAVVSAHQGRVNCIEFVPDHQLLVSASHDGDIHIWSLTVRMHDSNVRNDSPQLIVDRVASFSFNSTLSNPTRLTALACWMSPTIAHASATTVENHTSVLLPAISLAVGTQYGSVCFLSLHAKHSTESTTHNSTHSQCDNLWEFSTLGMVQIDDCDNTTHSSITSPKPPPTIYCLCPLSSDGSDVTDAIAVGHANGLGSVTVQ